MINIKLPYVGWMTNTIYKTWNLDKIKNIILYDFKLGDTVRKKLSKKVFDKGYERKWTIKTYTIINENNGLYELNDGSIVRGDDMQKVPDINYEESDKRHQLQKELKKLENKKEKKHLMTQKLIKLMKKVMLF